MSADYLRLVPNKPNFVPDKAAQTKAVGALQSLLPAGSDCEARDHGHVVFIDQGENLETVICPVCSQRLRLYDDPSASTNLGWWYDTMDRIDDEKAENIVTKMPCCGRSAPLTSLQFDWPAAFARFELSILDPGIGENLSRNELAQFEKMLGCELIQVRAHY